MAAKKTDTKRPIESYEHRDKERVNNPPVGLVTPQTDPDAGQTKKRYAYDPHLDPQLVWAGKAEHTSFAVPTISLHVHERIDPRTIIEAVKKRNGSGGAEQLSLFEEERREPLRQAVEFYQHKHGWTNRLIAGDSLLVMNSLLEKEGMAGKVQMIYLDPPYGIKYGSNFQPFVNKRDVKDGKDEDLTSEPEQIRAFRDTWELGIHSYLTYLRDRLLLARELLTESGSIFVQIGDENVHRVRCLMDEVFGAENHMCIIPFIKTSGKGAKYLDVINDYLLWYAKKSDQLKYNQLYQLRSKKTMDTAYNWIELPTGEFRKLTRTELDGEAPIPEGMRFVSGAMISQSGGESSRFPVEVNGETYLPSSGTFWKTNLEGMENLKRARRLVAVGKTLAYKRYAEDFPVVAITNWWGDTKESTYAADKVFVVQTYTKVIERCLLMTTDPGDLVFDPTCVRKGTRVWCVRDGGNPPIVPPHAGGRSLPACGEGRGGAGRGEASWEGATLRPIESIQPGDWVLGHDGQPHRVVRVIRRPYRGRMIGIRHEKADATLWLSADHKVLAKRRPRSLGGHNDWSGIPPVLRGRSKTLRREMTPPERKLWTVLRNGQAGFTFRRQHPIGRYIADFYSRDAQLVVEVDGVLAHSSEEALAHDQARDAYLRELGLEVLRVPAREVLSNLEGVYETIRHACQLQLSVEKAEWVEAQDLAVGDWVFFGPQRVAVRIAELHTQETEEELYDLEVEDAHSFITELCVVHNCGSGTAAYVAEQWGRRWITCDTSRVAITIARQRLMTAVFDYYELAHPQEGVGSGFKYKTVPHVTLKSIANNPEIDGIYARLHPAVAAALAELNAALHGQPVKFQVTQGGRAGQFVDFAAPDEATFTMPAGQVVKVNELVEWEVPFTFPADWPEKAREPFERFHQARRTLQKEIDAAIARHAPQETLYDQPFVDRKKVRVTGPFTVEAVPAPAVKSVDEILEEKPQPADTSITRSGETLRQAEWRDELLRTGIRGKNGQYIRFARLEPLPGCRWLHAEGETRPSDEGANTVRETAPAYDPMRVVVSFGPEYGPLEQRQVEHAWQEARMLSPQPKLLIFAAFQFDPEAAKDIDEMKPELAGMQFLKVQMNADLLTDDLKKKRASNESFWLIGQPDVELRKAEDGWFVVEVHGFDYYNTKTGAIESGGKDKIAMWMLDTDYDGRCLYPRQVFFPMAGEKEGWAKLARNLKAEIDEDLIKAYSGTVSLPFAPGEHKRIAVKIVDDRGIESLKVMELPI
ncbi:very-short-patch-repair endonuclease/DNA modification methylase [Thermostichus sp. MS-CIW-19]